jgi:hypothetical protein
MTMRLDRPAAAAALITAGLLLGAPAASAQTVVDPYTGLEVASGVNTLPPTGGSSTVGAPAVPAPPTTNRPTVRPTTLPFTGGELVGVAAAGALATAVGIGFVAAGRRRQTA